MNAEQNDCGGFRGYTPDDVPNYTGEQIRHFFAKRPFARPPDWDKIKWTPQRTFRLRCWIHGYSVAKG